MKFKPHFVLLFMIAACAIFVTATVGKAASASAAAYDCDVGWQSPQDNGAGIPALDNCSPVSLPCEMPQDVPSAPEPGWLNDESQILDTTYWPTRDSKASRCEAIGLFINTYVFLPLDLRNDGNEARRLSIKAKA